MSDELETLFRMYEEQTTQARHYESQRSTASGFLLAISAAVIGLITFDGALSREDLPAAALVVILGLLGVMLSWAYQARSTRHGKRAQRLREHIGTTVPEVPIERLRQEGDQLAAAKLGLFKNAPPLGQIWLAMHALTFAAGLVLARMALQQPPRAF